MQTEKGEFGGWRSFFWPVYRSEWKKFFPLLGIFFLIAFNYNLLRTFKDSIVVTAPNSGVEAIPFIKVWAILPGALLLTYLFTRLANRFKREQVFYLMMLLFLGFFFVFTFFLYPLRDTLHPHGVADYLQSILPAGFKGFIAIFRNWTFTLFYVMCELWGTAIMTVLFWGFMNEVASVHEAKRYYGLLMIGANISSILAGQLSIWFAHFSFLPTVPYGTTKWEQSIFFLNSAIILSGIVIIGLFRWVNVHAIRPPEILQKAEDKVEKVKMSLRKNFAYLAKSKYLICIAAIVLTYNVALNLTEVVWKDHIKAIYPDPSDFQAYMGQITTAIGVVAAILSLFTGTLLRKFSWTGNALITAAIVLLSGIGFFAFALFQNTQLGALAAFTGFSPLAFCLLLGSLQNIFTRSCKYTFFDATKEIAFIPLSNESKLKGKAAIDGIGSRLGKSGGSIIHQGLIFLCATVSASTPYVAAIFFAILLVWILATISLGKQFDALIEKKQKLEIKEEALLSE